jgi:drug/metabolite transporter (DMT)-like permease
MWFIFALLSTLFAGMQSFGQKIAAEKKYDTVLMSAIAAFISSIIAIAFFVWNGDYFAFPYLFYWLAIISGGLFILSSIARLEALQFIDSTIHFPLYKVVGPAAVAILGIGLLYDQVSSAELLGIVLSCFVPILLISKSENHRQKNLRLGVALTIGATLLAAVGAVVNAYAIALNADLVLPLVIVANGCAFVFGLGLFLRRHKPHEMAGALKQTASLPFLSIACLVGVSQFLGFYLFLLAITGSNVSLVYSINAHYILIPVLLSVWLYKEHWNMQKALALILSMLALVLLHR